MLPRLTALQASSPILATGGAASASPPVALFEGGALGKLKGLSSRLSPLRPKLASVAVDRQSFDRARDQRPWRQWYKTARWQALRWQVLLRDLFTCQMCGRLEGDTSKLVADHRKPHRGIEALFWDIANLWTLCAPCHSSTKQREEHGEA
jgi:5-methylcytosine-specific restriction endonuclease McrA